MRLLGRVLQRTSITKMDHERIARVQRQHVRRNRVADAVLGGIAPEVGITDGTAAGEAGPLRIRSYRPEALAGGSLPLVVDFHGGGWVFGPRRLRLACSHVAAAAGAVVVVPACLCARRRTSACHTATSSFPRLCRSAPQALSELRGELSTALAAAPTPA